ncbi:MAG: hypothetical protein JSU94_21005, partial [Phycisphaerales bacterium]
NVYEWMENRYSETEPTRCLRGGSWSSLDSFLRCSFGHSPFLLPDDRSGYFGFRVVFSQS